MTRLTWARVIAGAAAVILLAVMIWLGETQIKPVAPDGKLLQAQVFGYDTLELSLFGLEIARSDVEPLYRATLLYLDSAFILAFAIFTVAMIWPNRLLGPSLAFLYAVTDFMENQYILDAVGRMSASAVDPPLPVAGMLSVAGYLTAQKYLLIALIVGSIVVTWTRQRS